MRVGNRLHTLSSRLSLPVRRPSARFASLLAACHPAVKSTLPGPPTRTLNSRSYGSSRLLAATSTGASVAKRWRPIPTATYTVIEIKRTGFSPGYTVTGPDGREWSAKFPPEAPTEVVASRIHWGVGYHQPPIYYVQKWLAEKATSPNPQLPARFREKNPAFNGRPRGHRHLVLLPESLRRHARAQGTARAAGDARQLRSQGRQQRDLRARRSRSKARGRGMSPAIWGIHSAGPASSTLRAATSRSSRRRRSSPVSSTAASRSTGAGATMRCFDDITPADVRWICGRLQRLREAQWRDAFRAGGYPPGDAERYIRRLKQKIAEGLALEG